VNNGTIIGIKDAEAWVVTSVRDALLRSGFYGLRPRVV
jgi:hypothetical protein